MSRFKAWLIPVALFVFCGAVIYGLHVHTDIFEVLGEAMGTPAL